MVEARETAGAFRKCRNSGKRVFFLVIFTVLFFVFSAESVFGEIVFSGLDLAGDNRLLLRAASGTGAFAQDALFLARLSATASGRDFSFQQLSAWPEKMELLENGRVLQIRNTFGSYRISLSGGLLLPVPGFPSFAGGDLPAGGRTEETASSPDGRWILRLEPLSPATGNLVLVDVLSGAGTLAASPLERPGNLFPASWSPDSRFFIYERAGKLYYYAPGSSLVPAEEGLRFIGEGTVNSIFWSRDGDFFYLRDSTLYKVRGRELFTRALYTGFLEAGDAAGKIPFDFNPRTDRYWMAPDGRSLLLSTGHRGLMYVSLGTEAGPVPWLTLPPFCTNPSVLWSPGGIVTVLAPVFTGTGDSSNPGGKVNSWRLDTAGGKPSFEPVPEPFQNKNFSFGSLSPDGKLALLWGPGGIALYDYRGWKLLELLSTRPAVSCLWAGNRICVTGDDEKIERVSLRGTPSAGSVVSGRELVAFSRAGETAFEEKTYRVLVKSGGSWFVTDGRTPWAPAGNPVVRNPSLVSAQYRVYLEKQGSGPFANLPMVRNVDATGTFSLFVPPPASELSPDAAGGAGEAALCFDLYDDDRGLAEVLAALDRFGVKATFFLNGEFIRRHPGAAAEIAAKGHEAASMFFAPVDLSAFRYRAGDDFIPRGLARNEDEFFRVTGKELALLWHAPRYADSPDISASAAAAGYVTVRRDIDPMDWVSREDEKNGLPLRTVPETIDHIMEAVKPGSVIPVRLGLLPGGKSDYLFYRITVLLDALVRRGYTLTTVSDLAGNK